MTPWFGKTIAPIAVIAILSVAGCGGGTLNNSSAPVTYTIGGTVAGLSGSGLVLQNNGSNALTVSAGAASFTFSTAIASGGAYSVTVLSQPSNPSQTCMVSGGSGTVASANVTSVQLTCTSIYTIGGTISGLSGSGLVLQDNGSNALTVSAGAASFTFSTAIASGGAYSVTVLSQPSNPSQTCRVSSGSGTVAGANVTSVAVSCITFSGGFVLTGSMTTAREGHTATLLNNGMVLVAGGSSSGVGLTSSLASAELYDPTMGTFTATGSMTNARRNPTATLLTDGNVLVAGGVGSGGGLTGGVIGAELYDPTTGTFTVTGSMTNARQNPTATLLTNGNVLVAGGGDAPALASAELYNPIIGTFTFTGSMTNARTDHTATLLTNGKVLVAGGIGTSAVLTSAELYLP
jgi:hypothetical protein